MAILPVQGDLIEIPPDGGITDGVGMYEITDQSWNGGGEITLILRKYESPTLIESQGEETP